MILDGKTTADKIQDEIRETIKQFSKRKPFLAVIQVGNYLPSQIYIRRKMQACEKVGIKSQNKQFPENVSASELLSEIALLNQDPTVDGILIQLPLSPHLDPAVITQAVDPAKDVDGLHPINVGKLLLGQQDGFTPCTPLGIQTLLLKYQIEVSGKQALVIGRSNIVGKPMAALLLQNAPGGNATVTIAHSKTPNLKEICLKADIVIAALGQPKIIQADMIKEGSVIIDVGINRVEDKIVGDVDFESVKEKCAWITPVPGGVGPMTIAMLLNNTLKSYRRREHV